MNWARLVSGGWPGVECESFGWLGFLLRHADPGSAAVIVIVYFLIRPLFSKMSFFAADRNRLLPVHRDLP